MHGPARLALLTVAAMAALPATAVTLNPRGLGQVLVYPYYTVNAGFGTLLSVVNTTPDGKALKVRFREGYDGRDVLDFNLYLSPFDAWAGQVFDTSADGSGVAALASFDHSCTTPGFLLPVDPHAGPPRANFSTAGYSGANADGGPTGPQRTREGYIEVIEMGVVTNAVHATLDAITHDSAGAPANCAQLVAAWSAGGYWIADPGVDLAPPSGGLYGAESVINVGEGAMFAVNAEAIDGFSTAVQHTDPGNPKPDLASASKSGDGTVSAFVPASGAGVTLTFSAPEDAISALFVAARLDNEYVVDPAIGASTDWVVTFPTKRFYTDPALLAGNPGRPPFHQRFGSDPNQPGTSCLPLDTPFRSREEQQVGWVFFPESPPYASTAACFATSVFTFGTPTSVLGSRLVRDSNDVGYPSVVPVDAGGFAAGHAAIDFLHDFFGSEQPRPLSASGGLTLQGLPAIGFAAINYVNGNVTPGTLANYSGASPHRAEVGCVQTGTCVPIP